MDYGYIRNQIMFLAKKRLDISTIFIRMRNEAQRCDVIVETLIRISDARKVAKMLIDGLYVEDLYESLPIFKRNGVGASEITTMLNPFVLDNEKMVARLLMGEADPNLIIERANNEIIQRHLDALIKAGADANMIAERITQLDEYNGAWVIRTLDEANADINILINHVRNEDIERWCQELIDAGADTALMIERTGNKDLLNEIIIQKAV
jgi:hypothetical protein